MSAAKELETSIKVLDELFAKLNVASNEEELSSACTAVASFINGPIEGKIG
jgi:hypothetical protein